MRFLYIIPFSIIIAGILRLTNNICGIENNLPCSIQNTIIIFIVGFIILLIGIIIDILISRGNNKTN